MWAAAFLLRRLRVEVGIALLIVGLVAATSLVFSAAPRLLDRVSDDGLRHEVESSGPVQRNLQLSTVSVLPDAEDSLEAVNELGDSFADEFPAVVRNAIAGSAAGLHHGALRHRRSARLHDLRQPSLPVRPGRRHPHDRWAAAGLDRRLPGPGLVRAGPVRGAAAGGPAGFEIAVSDATAREIGVGVGDVLFGTADGADPLIGRAFQRAPGAASRWWASTP